MTRTPLRSTIGIVILTGFAALTGCTGEPETEATPITTDISTAQPSQAQTPAPTPTEDLSGPDPANPDPLPEVTAPGTQISFGESATIQTAVGVLEIEEGWAYLTYTVSGIEEGDTSILDELDDSEQFDRVSYIRGTLEVVALAGAGRGNSIVGGTIIGLQDDGTSTAYPLTLETNPACEGDFLITQPTVGQVVETCHIALIESGRELIGAMYYGDGSVVAGGTSDNPYYSNPVVWYD